MVGTITGVACFIFVIGLVNLSTPTRPIMGSLPTPRIPMRGVNYYYSKGGMTGDDKKMMTGSVPSSNRLKMTRHHLLSIHKLTKKSPEFVKFSNSTAMQKSMKDNSTTIIFA
jgi:hypothetical protein